MKTLLSPSKRATALVNAAFAALIFVANLTFATAANAGPGHDHGNEAPATATSVASPRVTGHSDLFEVVGIVDAGVMTIYLDRYATNSPVTGATVEVEAGTAKGVAKPQADGTYRFEHAVLKQPGAVPVSFTVTDGKDTDLLAGDLKLADPHAGHDHDGPVARPWVRWGGYAAAALFLLAAAALTLRSLRRPRSL